MAAFQQVPLSQAQIDYATSTTNNYGVQFNPAYAFSNCTMIPTKGVGGSPSFELGILVTATGRHYGQQQKAPTLDTFDGTVNAGFQDVVTQCLDLLQKQLGKGPPA